MYSAAQTKLFEARGEHSEKSSTVKATESKSRPENSQKAQESEPPAFDLQKALKRIKDEEFFEKEYAKDLKKRQKEKEAYIKQAAEQRKLQENREETQSLHEESKDTFAEFKPKLFATKQAKPLNKLNKTELFDKFVDGDIAPNMYCDLIDA